MSFKGNNPSSKWLNFEPQAADPSSPNEGDLFYSDGTPRLEGLWVYINATWAQVSTSVAASVFDNITLTPAAATPSPALGMLFNSDGTSRAAGIWLYTSTGWAQLTGVRYQEFTIKDAVTVRVATLVAGILASDFDNGSTVDSTVLVTGDLILIKNQAAASENGVYTVQASGAPVRHSSADTYQELNDNYCAVVNAQSTTGTVVTTSSNTTKIFYQTSVLASLSDNQVWSETPANYSFTVPSNVTEIEVLAVGAGGGGGGGGARSTIGGGAGGAGGGGGGGGQYKYHKLLVTPGDVLTATLGKRGQGGRGGTDNSNNAVPGTVGGDTILISGGTTKLTSYGGAGGGYGAGAGVGWFNGGAGGSTNFMTGGAGGIAPASNGNNAGGGGGAGNLTNLYGPSAGAINGVNAGAAGFCSGAGGGGARRDFAGGSAGGTGGVSDFILVGATGGAGGGGTPAAGGGGGGASYGAGGAGGAFGSISGSHGTNGGGGGGGGGAKNGPVYGAQAGTGGGGYIRFSW